MLALHRVRGTWIGAVDTYIALSEFSRRKFIEGGLPGERIMVKPNFLAPDPGTGNHTGGFALFVGRLSAEKGVHTLLQAWRQLPRSFPLKIVGDGPLFGTIGPSPAAVEWIGHVSRGRVLSLMRDATFLIVPSEVYENFPLTVLEAFATGLPVIASGHGALEELVLDGQTGRLFRPGDAGALSATLEWALDHREDMQAMAERARAEYDARYSAERNYRLLMQVYNAARARLKERE
jgi:glycosyltransferase involved in cell wall biosynthesis